MNARERPAMRGAQFVDSLRLESRAARAVGCQNSCTEEAVVSDFCTKNFTLARDSHATFNVAVELLHTDQVIELTSRIGQCAPTSSAGGMEAAADSHVCPQMSV